METKAENPANLLTDDVSPLLQAYFELSQLKQLYRQGWLRRGISKERCESVAEHSFGVALLALWLVKSSYPYLDAEKTMTMALLHDFGEVYAGDIIPVDQIAVEQKHQLEQDSIQRVFDKLPGGETYRQLWEEFEAGKTPEARLVRQLDRLEMGLQAAVYRAQKLGDLQEFLISAMSALQDPQLIDLLRQADVQSAKLGDGGNPPEKL